MIWYKFLAIDISNIVITLSMVNVISVKQYNSYIHSILK